MAAEAQAAVVTLKLPGRAFVHGLFVDDWPDEEVRLEQLLLDGLDSGDVTIGSAVMIEGSGIAVTTAQLGRRALLLKAVTADGRRVSAMVVGRDEETNVAVLTLCCDQRPFHAIALGNSDAVKVGDRVVAVGAPFGLEHSATASVVSGRTTDDADALGVLLHTGPTVTSGYAGGPVVDTTPTMVGLVVRNEAGMGMVLPSNTVRRIVSAILEDGRVRRGSLGVKGQTLDADLAETFGASAIRGVIVVDVRHGGPAARAGFRTGDIISAIDGRQVDSSARLARAVAALAPGRTVSVALWRDGRALTAPVRVDEEPDDEAIGSLGWRSHALLGADVAAITSDIGVVVAGVEPGGPAERAGIRRLDVIREMNGLMIRSLDDFNDALKTLTVESRVPVLLQRGATSLYVTLRP
ncbi:MAG TPA: PDZ domain-containing protein [Methylomirabilota bacterium]|nr:PDZ domain-containing protein [Methylomirabilota bacterium]